MAFTQNQSDNELEMGLLTTSFDPTISWLSYSLAASVPNSAASKLAGAIDSPDEWYSGYGLLNVSGWAIDSGSATGTGVDRIQVLMDGAYLADATYGSTRSDIGAAYGARFTGSGYRVTLDLNQFSVGNHTLELRAHSTLTGANTSYLRAVSVIAVPTRPLGSIDSPGAGSTVSGSVRVSGWMLDAAAASGTGVDRVQVFLDNAYVANATYGTARPDIGSAFGAQFTPSGYTYTLSLAGVAPGSHTVKIHARSTVTGIETTYTKTVNVS
jgi:hypothetical protein